MTTEPPRKHNGSQNGDHIIRRRGLVVVLGVVAHNVPLRSAAAVEAQRAAARTSLARCAAECGAPGDGWRQRADGVPLVNDGWHWSLSHKRRLAGAAVSDTPVGLDIESLEPRRRTLLDGVAEEREWTMLGGKSWPTFFRLWTAKEATLKANGVGLGAWDDCRLVKPDGLNVLLTTFRGDLWSVEQGRFNDHLFAIARPAGQITGAGTSRPH